MEHRSGDKVGMDHTTQGVPATNHTRHSRAVNYDTKPRARSRSTRRHRTRINTRSPSCRHRSSAKTGGVRVKEEQSEHGVDDIAALFRPPGMPPMMPVGVATRPGQQLDSESGDSPPNSDGGQEPESEQDSPSHVAPRKVVGTVAAALASSSSSGVIQAPFAGQYLSNHVANAARAQTASGTSVAAADGVDDSQQPRQQFSKKPLTDSTKTQHAVMVFSANA